MNEIPTPLTLEQLQEQAAREEQNEYQQVWHSGANTAYTSHHKGALMLAGIPMFLTKEESLLWKHNKHQEPK